MDSEPTPNQDNPQQTLVVKNIRQVDLGLDGEEIHWQHSSTVALPDGLSTKAVSYEGIVVDQMGIAQRATGNMAQVSALFGPNAGIDARASGPRGIEKISVDFKGLSSLTQGSQTQETFKDGSARFERESLQAQKSNLTQIKLGGEIDEVKVALGPFSNIHISTTIRAEENQQQE